MKAGTITVRLTSEEGLMAAMQASVQQMRAIQKGWVGSDHGGASGRDLKERWRSDERPPSWWVPYEKLRPAQELHEIFQHRVLAPEGMSA